DATIISAPSSTRNRDGERDPEMHQTAKGQQWYFGMKAHVAVDSRSKLFHTVLVSAANVADRDALSIGVVKRVFGFQKVRYRELAKNLHRLEVSAALANLFMVRRQLLRLQG
ncbi:MAG: transposase, partial [Steroidobacteraceae bacterium]